MRNSRAGKAISKPQQPAEPETEQDEEEEEEESKEEESEEEEAEEEDIWSTKPGPRPFEISNPLYGRVTSVATLLAPPIFSSSSTISFPNRNSKPRKAKKTKEQRRQEHKQKYKQEREQERQIRKAKKRESLASNPDNEESGAAVPTRSDEYQDMGGLSSKGELLSNTVGNPSFENRDRSDEIESSTTSKSKSGTEPGQAKETITQAPGNPTSANTQSLTIETSKMANHPGNSDKKGKGKQESTDNQESEPGGDEDSGQESNLPYLKVRPDGMTPLAEGEERELARLCGTRGEPLLPGFNKLHERNPSDLRLYQKIMDRQNKLKHIEQNLVTEMEELIGYYPTNLDERAVKLKLTTAYKWPYDWFEVRPRTEVAKHLQYWANKMKMANLEDDPGQEKSKNTPEPEQKSGQEKSKKPTKTEQKNSQEKPKSTKGPSGEKRKHESPGLDPARPNPAMPRMFMKSSEEMIEVILDETTALALKVALKGSNGRITDERPVLMDVTEEESLAFRKLREGKVGLALGMLGLSLEAEDELETMRYYQALRDNRDTPGGKSAVDRKEEDREHDKMKSSIREGSGSAMMRDEEIQESKPKDLKEKPPVFGGPSSSGSFSDARPGTRPGRLFLNPSSPNNFQVPNSASTFSPTQQGFTGSPLRFPSGSEDLGTQLGQMSSRDQSQAGSPSGHHQAGLIPASSQTQGALPAQVTSQNQHQESARADQVSQIHNFQMPTGPAAGSAPSQPLSQPQYHSSPAFQAAQSTSQVQNLPSPVSSNSQTLVRPAAQPSHPQVVFDFQNQQSNQPYHGQSIPYNDHNFNYQPEVHRSNPLPVSQQQYFQPPPFSSSQFQQYSGPPQYHPQPQSGFHQQVPSHQGWGQPEPKHNQFSQGRYLHDSNQGLRQDQTDFPQAIQDQNVPAASVQTYHHQPGQKYHPNHPHQTQPGQAQYSNTRYPSYAPGEVIQNPYQPNHGQMNYPPPGHSLHTYQAAPGQNQHLLNRHHPSQGTSQESQNVHNEGQVWSHNSGSGSGSGGK